MQVPLPVWRRACPCRQVRLYYHTVSESQPRHLVHYPVLTPRDFAADLDLLDEQFGLLPAGQSDHPDARGALITFDDGLVEVFDVARPLLLSRGATALFFVTSSLIDNTVAFHETESALCLRAALALDDDGLVRFLRRARAESRVAEVLAMATRRGGVRLRRGQLPTLNSVQEEAAALFLSLGQADADIRRWACDELRVDSTDYVRTVRPYVSGEQLRQMAREGFVVGGHGVSHIRLGRLEPARRHREILESCDRVRQITGQSRVPFSFPYSGSGVGADEIHGLTRANPWLGPFYDSGGLRRAPGRLHRAWAESVFRGRRPGGIDSVLRHAWATSLL